MKWKLDALKMLAKNPTVPGIALKDAISEIERLSQQLAKAQARIDELIPECNAAYAPYREMVQEARAETDKFSTELYKAKAEIERLWKSQARWIPVGERLPEVEGLYWVWCKWMLPEAHCGIQAEWRFHSWNVDEVTYWMPLPPGPEEAKSE